ncbi:hypothetical protein [Streptomyces sp. KL116D]|uniref:hypothetical protein n=1 Tax=Streptomyces sp. KL116D TaxID=3045152 RepID=UPI0035590E28
MLQDHCSLYNGALQERRDAYRHASKTSIKYGQRSAQLKEIAPSTRSVRARWSFSSQQATLRRLDKAFAAFFRRVKSGHPSYPRFRDELVRHGGLPQGTATDAAGTPPRDPVTRAPPGVGHVRVHQHRPVKGRVNTVSIKRGGRR